MKKSKKILLASLFTTPLICGLVPLVTSCSKKEEKKEEPKPESPKNEFIVTKDNSSTLTDNTFTKTEDFILFKITLDNKSISKDKYTVSIEQDKKDIKSYFEISQEINGNCKISLKNDENRILENITIIFTHISTKKSQNFDNFKINISSQINENKQSVISFRSVKLDSQLETSANIQADFYFFKDKGIISDCDFNDLFEIDNDFFSVIRTFTMHYKGLNNSFIDINYNSVTSKLDLEYDLKNQKDIINMKIDFIPLSTFYNDEPNNFTFQSIQFLNSHNLNYVEVTEPVDPVEPTDPVEPDESETSVLETSNFNIVLNGATVNNVNYVHVDGNQKIEIYKIEHEITKFWGIPNGAKIKVFYKFYRDNVMTHQDYVQKSLNVSNYSNFEITLNNQAKAIFHCNMKSHGTISLYANKNSDNHITFNF